MRPHMIALVLAASAGTAHAQMDMSPHQMGGDTFTMVMIDRLEVGRTDGEEHLAWEADAWHGGDISKLRLKTEGEIALDDSEVEEMEIQALYSRAVTSFFDLNMGLRQDLKPDPDRTHAVVGLQGLAPYWFELDSALFLSHKGDLTGRIEAEYELLFTQRLILQPRAELAFSAQDAPELGIGSGFTGLDLGLRLRYEIVREFAPYVGIEWQKSFGDTADFARAGGEDPDAMVVLAGVRAWF